MDSVASRGRLVLVALCVARLCTACVQAGGEAGGVEVARNAVVYGHDGRSELWQAPSETLRIVARTANVALLDRADVSVTPDGLIALPADSAQELLGLCADEPFASQPAAARCSGVLVARNLVLTAAHCARRMRCEDLVAVRGFAYEAPNQLRPLDSSDIARCKRVIQSVPTWDPHGKRGLDYAWLELDGELDPGVPPPLELAGAIATGSTVALIGHGQGLPVKIDEGGTVVSMNAPIEGQLRASIDNFGGGSGAGVFDEAGTLLGIAVHGAYDFEATDEGCLRTRRLQDADGVEVVTLAARAVDGLCEVAPEAQPCGPPAGCAVQRGGNGGVRGTASFVAACAAVIAWLARRTKVILSNRR